MSISKGPWHLPTPEHDERLLRFFTALLRSFRDADLGHVADVALNFRQIEAIANRGFLKHGLELTRLSQFRAVIKAEFGKHSSEVAIVLVDDMRGLESTLLSAKDVDTVLDNTPMVMRFAAGSEKEYFQALATGVKRANPLVFRRYMHNNHCVRRMTEAPELFLRQALAHVDSAHWGPVSIVLEETYVTTKKLADVTAVMRLTELPFTTPGGRRISLVPPEGLAIHVSVDSKVCVDANGVRNALDQQKQLFFGDRLSSVRAVLAHLNAPDVALNGAEKEAALRVLIPTTFRHYIFTPHDFPGPGYADGGAAALAGLHASYRRSVGAYVRDRIAKPVGGELAGVSREDLQLLERVLLDHVDQHFGAGEYLVPGSELSYEWLVDPALAPN